VQAVLDVQEDARAYPYWLWPRLWRQRLGIDDFIVTTFCEQKDGRREKLLDLLKELDPEKQGTDIFYVADHDVLSIERPQQLLFDPVWTTPAGNRGSIFASHPSRVSLDEELGATVKRAWP
jgi:hypothetical protein